MTTNDQCTEAREQVRQLGQRWAAAEDVQVRGYGEAATALVAAILIDAGRPAPSFAGQAGGGSSR